MRATVAAAAAAHVATAGAQAAEKKPPFFAPTAAWQIGLKHPLKLVKHGRSVMPQSLREFGYTSS